MSEQEGWSETVGRAADKPKVGADFLLPLFGVIFAAYYLYTIRELPWEARVTGVFVCYGVYILSAILFVRSLAHVRQVEVIFRCRMRAAALAQGAGIEMSSHLFPEFSVHLLGVTPTCHWLEYMDWAAPLLQEPLRVVGGRAQIPDRPGAGIAWDEAAVKRCAV